MDTFGGSVANYSCNETYLLCGTESIICQSNGSWSALPDCISKLSMYLCMYSCVGYTVCNRTILLLTFTKLTLKLVVPFKMIIFDVGANFKPA